MSTPSQGADAGPRGRRSRGPLRALLLALSLLAILAAAAAIWLPRLAAERVGGTLRAAAEARGFEVEWGRIDVSLSGAIRVDDVRFRHRGDGQLDGELSSLETRVSWGQVWRGERPRRAVVRGARVRADIEGLRVLQGDARGADPTAVGSEDGSRAGRQAVEIEVVDVDGLVELDGGRTVVCSGRDVRVELGAESRLLAELDCRAPDSGLETGAFQLDARYTPANPRAPLQLVLEPEAAFRAQVAGARFGRVSASLGPDGGRIEVAELALSPQPTESVGDGRSEWPLAVREVSLDALVVMLARHDGELTVARVEAGPGHLALERPARAQADDDGPRFNAAETEGDEAEDDDEAELALEEAADQALPQASAGVWTDLETDLTRLTRRASQIMATATDLIDRIELRGVDVRVDLGDAGVVSGQLVEVVATPGRAVVEAKLEEHALRLEIARAPDAHGLTLALSAESIALGQVSRVLGFGDLATGSLDLDLRLTTNSGLEIEAGLALDGGVVRHAGVATKPLELAPIELDLSVRFDPDAENRLAVGGRGHLGEVAGGFQAHVTAEGDESRLEADFALDETSCASLLGAIPDGLFANLSRDEIQVAGRAGVDGEVRFTFGDPHSFRLRFGEQFPGTCEIVSLPLPFSPRALLEPSYVRAVPDAYLYDEGDDVAGVDDVGPVVVGPGTDRWVPLEELPEYVPAAMYFSEQRLFYEEPAISVRLINRAVRVNLIYGRWAYGGSTITQQLVKNLFLDRSKTLGRKLEEALISWAVFEALTRDQILELYVNCIEFGPNVWGIEAAAQYYFGISARELAPEQAVYLAGLKPSPRSGGSHRRRGASPSRTRWRERIRDRLQELVEAGLVDQAYADAQHPYIVPLPGPSGEDVTPEEPRIAPID